MELRKYQVILVDLNPTKGSEQQGVRPCLILQNNIANESQLATVTIAPFTSVLKNYPASVIVRPSRKNGLSTDSRLELTQIRTIDKHRIRKVQGMLESGYHAEIRQKIVLFFDLNDEF